MPITPPKPQRDPDSREAVENLADYSATNWGLVQDALQPTVEIERRRVAMEGLLKVYGRAIRNYLGGALRDVDLVNDAYQTLAERMLSGGFAKVDPAKGKFRHYLKTVLCRLVTDIHRRKLLKSFNSTGIDDPVTPEPEYLSTDDANFLRHWNRGLLEIAWERLRLEQKARPETQHFTALKFKSSHPDAGNAELAAVLSRELDSEINTTKAGNILLRARDRYANLLAEAVAATLNAPGSDEVEQELIDLGLHQYVHQRLKR